MSQCCSVGGALPLPALRCVRHRLQRGPRARRGEEQEGGEESVGEESPVACPLNPQRAGGGGARGGKASNHSLRVPRPLWGEKGASPR